MEVNQSGGGDGVEEDIDDECLTGVGNGCVGGIDLEKVVVGCGTGRCVVLWQGDDEGGRGGELSVGLIVDSGRCGVNGGLSTLIL